MDPYVLNLQDFRGRKVVIDLPPRENREYIACNKEDWKVRIDADSFKGEDNFLWNYEDGKKVIYSSYVIKNNIEDPINFDLKLPLWSVVPQPYIMLNSAPILPCPGIKQCVSESFKSLRITDIYAEGRITSDCVFFSKSAINAFGLDIKIYMELAGQEYVLWEKQVMLNEGDNPGKKATFKKEEYHLWDARLSQDWVIDLDQGLNYIIKSNDFIRLGVSIQIISPKEGFLGKKEDPNASLFSLENFHYVIGLADAD